MSLQYRYNLKQDTERCMPCLSVGDAHSHYRRSHIHRRLNMQDHRSLYRSGSRNSLSLEGQKKEKQYEGLRS